MTLSDFSMAPTVALRQKYMLRQKGPEFAACARAAKNGDLKQLQELREPIDGRPPAAWNTEVCCIGMCHILCNVLVVVVVARGGPCINATRCASAALGLSVCRLEGASAYSEIRACCWVPLELVRTGRTGRPVFASTCHGILPASLVRCLVLFALFHRNAGRSWQQQLPVVDTPKLSSGPLKRAGCDADQLPTSARALMRDHCNLLEMGLGLVNGRARKAHHSLDLLSFACKKNLPCFGTSLLSKKVKLFSRKNVVCLPQSKIWPQEANNRRRRSHRFRSKKTGYRLCHQCSSYRSAKISSTGSLLEEAAAGAAAGSPGSKAPLSPVASRPLWLPRARSAPSNTAAKAVATSASEALTVRRYAAACCEVSTRTRVPTLVLLAFKTSTPSQSEPSTRVKPSSPRTAGTCSANLVFVQDKTRESEVGPIMAHWPLRNHTATQFPTSSNHTYTAPQSGRTV